jgi:hypothetical protein
VLERVLLCVFSFPPPSLIVNPFFIFLLPRVVQIALVVVFIVTQLQQPSLTAEVELVELLPPLSTEQVALLVVVQVAAPGH